VECPDCVVVESVMEEVGYMLWIISFLVNYDGGLFRRKSGLCEAKLKEEG
jgi:hypothetical protein